MKMTSLSVLGALLAGTTLTSWAQPLQNTWLSLEQMEQKALQQEPAAGPVTTDGTGVYAPTATDMATPQPLTGNDLATMTINALEHQNWEMAEYFARQLMQHPDPHGNGPMAAYGLALGLTQQGRYEEALTALQPLDDAPTSFKTAATKLAGTLHLQIAELALMDGNEPLARRHLETYEYYANTHPNKARAQRLWQKLNGQKTEQTYLRVGVLLPLSGTHAAIGKSLLKAMQLAVFQSDDTHVILYPEDTGSDALGVAAAWHKLGSLQVDAVVGPLLSTQVDALKNTMGDSRIPVLGLSSDPHVAGQNVHLFGYRPDQQARLIARHALAQGRLRVAALVPSTPYGYEVYDAFKDEVADMGGELVVANFFNPEKPDISAALETLLQLDLARANLLEERKQLEREFAELGNALPDDKLARLKAVKKAKPEAVVDFDALFLPAPAAQLSLITSQMAVYDLDRQDVMLLGTAAWQGPELLRGGDYIKEGRFPALPAQPEFTARYATVFGKNPNGLAGLGYDAVRILAEAASMPGTLNANLLRPEGFAGLSGPIRFQTNGLSERGYAIDSMEKGRILHVKPLAKLLPPVLPTPINPEAAPPIWRYSPW